MSTYNEKSQQDVFVVQTLTPNEVSTDEQEATFLYSQILSEIFVDIKYKTATDVETALHETAAELREWCTQQPKEIEKISQFEKTYQSKTPVTWYTYDSAVYRVINEALREQNTETLYNVRYFIKDLHRQLAQLHQQWKSSLPNRQIVVYRGTVWPESQFEKQLRRNIGGLLSFSSFTSTSLEPTICEVFGDCAGQVGRSGIFFEIKLNLDTSIWPCAKITEESVFGDAEQEVLFTMGTVFRIVSVEPKQGQGNWIVKLDLTNDEDVELKTLGQDLRREIDADSPLIRLAKLLRRMGKYAQAKRLYERLLNFNQIEFNVHVSSSLDHDLGTICARLGDYKEALGYLKSALHCRSAMRISNTAPTLTEIGNVLAAQNNHKDAINNYNAAIEEELKQEKPNQLNLALIYKSLAFSLLSMGCEYDRAFEYLLQADDYEDRANLIKKKHHRRADTQNLMGLIFYATGEPEQALKCFERALEIETLSLPIEHPSTANTLAQIAATLDRLGRYDEALLWIKRAMDVAQKTFPSRHPQAIRLSMIEQRIRQRNIVTDKTNVDHQTSQD